MSKNVSYYFLFILFLIAGCSTENTTKYVLNVAVEPSEAGMVNPSNGEFEEGEEVSITASENEHWVFGRWQGGISGSQNPATVMMENDVNVTAIFVKKEYPLEVTINGQGEVQETVVQAKDYEHGTTVELSASPDDGWSFVSWAGDLSVSDNPSQITVEGESDVTANFEINTYPVSVEVQGSGNVDASPDKENYDHGEEVILTANSSTGWEFSHWDGDVEGSDNPLTLNITSESTIVAVFTEKTYQVNVTSSNGGDVQVDLVSGDEVDGRYIHGSELEATAHPEGEYEFAGWEGDINSNENPLSFTVTSNISINALFDKQCTVPKDCVSANFYAAIIVGDIVFESHLNIFNSLESPITITEIYIRRGDDEFAAQADNLNDNVGPGNGISYEIDYLPQPNVDQFSNFVATVIYKHNGTTYSFKENASVSTFKNQKVSKKIKLN